MKEYVVTYTVSTSYETVVKAKSQQEAKTKVAEVIGDPIKFDSIWEYHRVKKAN